MHIQHATIAQAEVVESILGAPCDISLRAIVDHHALPGEDGFVVLERLYLHELWRTAAGNGHEMARLAHTYPERVWRRRKAWGITWRELYNGANRNRVERLAQ